MRVLLLATIAGLLISAAEGSADACQPSFQGCGPAVVVFPAYTPEGMRIGTVEAGVHRPPFLERSRITGQPLTVIYNTPTLEPGAVDPGLTLMALPYVRPARTTAVYPVGY